MTHHLLIKVALLFPIALIVTNFDVRYRRIPNLLVIITLIGGLVLNLALGGYQGLFSSLAGCVVAFLLMLLLHFFGALGPGDVKLFASIGSVIGIDLVTRTFLVVVLTGGILALISIIRWGTFRESMQRVFYILAGFLPGWKIPRFEVPSDKRRTIPYGLAIVYGSLISLLLFRS